MELINKEIREEMEILAKYGNKRELKVRKESYKIALEYWNTIGEEEIEKIYPKIKEKYKNKKELEFMIKYVSLLQKMV